jgi:serine/threonine-protein kinase RsbW
MSYEKSGDSSHPPLTPGETAVITLSFPCSPEYVGTARLTILGVASRMGFTYDQVEDIRLAVGEACANAIERSGYTAGTSTATLLTLRCHVEASRLIVEIEDTGPSVEGAPAAEAVDTDRPASEIEGMNGQELGALLMEILVDEVTIESLPGGGTRVRLTKYANEN